MKTITEDCREFSEDEMDTYFKWLFTESTSPYDEVCDLLRKLPPTEKAILRNTINAIKKQEP
jgi:hypothetical protein